MNETQQPIRLGGIPNGKSYLVETWRARLMKEAAQEATNGNRTVDFAIAGRPNQTIKTVGFGEIELRKNQYAITISSPYDDSTINIFTGIMFRKFDEDRKFIKGGLQRLRRKLTISL